MEAPRHLGYAEEPCISEEALKEALIDNRQSLTEADIRRMQEER